MFKKIMEFLRSLFLLTVNPPVETPEPPPATPHAPIFEENEAEAA